jgi:hypothetical protein
VNPLVPAAAGLCATGRHGSSNEALSRLNHSCQSILPTFHRIMRSLKLRLAEALALRQLQVALLRCETQAAYGTKQAFFEGSPPNEEGQVIV